MIRDFPDAPGLALSDNAKNGESHFQPYSEDPICRFATVAEIAPPPIQEQHALCPPLRLENRLAYSYLQRRSMIYPDCRSEFFWGQYLLRHFSNKHETDQCDWIDCLGRKHQGNQLSTRRRRYLSSTPHCMRLASIGVGSFSS